MQGDIAMPLMGDLQHTGACIETLGLKMHFEIGQMGARAARHVEQGRAVAHAARVQKPAQRVRLVGVVLEGIDGVIDARRAAVVRV